MSKFARWTPAQLVERVQARRYRRDHGLASYNPETAAAIARRRSESLSAHRPERVTSRVA